MKNEELLSLARSARARAYAPYSNWTVGAALMTKSG
ncbi:MAG: cytidine deaminase, partial [Clostridiales bacterium]|nr:cytidine deaminase [Clostridiales bacterium]